MVIGPGPAGLKFWRQPLEQITEIRGPFVQIEDGDVAVAGGPVTKTFFNPAMTSSLITLSNTNLTATRQGGPAYDAATTAWINAVVAAGGSVSATQADRVDTLILALKGHGLFSANSRLWLHAGESDGKQATIDIMGLGVAVTTGHAPTLGAGGYTGNGSTQYVDLGTIPSDFTRLSGAYGGYCASSSSATNGILIGSYDGGICFTDFYPMLSASTAFARVNRQGSDAITATNANVRGLYIASTLNLGDSYLYKDGSQVGSNSGHNSVSIAGLPNFYALARNSNGTANEFSTNQTAASFIFPGLDATQVTNFSTDLNAYMTAWGI